MSKTIEVKVPGVGDFSNVDVIEVLVKAGDRISVDDPLITLETDKASMEVPSSAAGTIKELKVKVGDKVSEGSTILLLSADADQVDAATQDTPPAPKQSSNSEAKSQEQVSGGAKPAADKPATEKTPAASNANAGVRSYQGKVDIKAQLAVLGSGPGGYTAAFRAADLGLNTVLIEVEPTLGGVCLNVGCIPSKALLHAAEVIEHSRAFAAHGISFGKPKIDLDQLRGWKDKVVGRLTGGLTALAKQRKVQVVKGYGRFLDSYHLEVEAEGGKQVVGFERCIIAAGSEPVKLPFVPEDPRIFDSTGALEIENIPKRMLVIGGGIIGLEMATVYAALGTKITIVEMLDGLIAGADQDLVKPLFTKLKKDYESILLQTKVTKVEAQKNGLKVSFEGKQAPAEPQLFDRILVAVGRVPNGKKINAEAAGVQVDERGFIAVDKQQRTQVSHIHAIGDIVGQPMLAHKASHEGKVAAEVCAGMNSHFDALVIPSVAYTHPEVAWVGLTETEAKAQGIQYGKSVFPWAASGRALSLDFDQGMTKLIFDEQSGRLIGGGVVGPSAGDLIAEVALAIETHCDAADIGLTVHPHPTLSETVAMAAEAFEGTITDLYLPKKSGPKKTAHK